MQAPDPQRIASFLELWFARHQRLLPWRETYDPYHVWVSEVMLQQTRMEVVLGYFGRFLERFPDVAALAAATDDEVTTAWSGLGYYRRAKMLRRGAEEVLARFGGRIPQTVEELLAIPGIGRYTAGAIASVAFRERAPIVDGNVARVTSRLFALESPLGSPSLMRDAWQRAEELVAACDDPRALNQGLMELGAMLCKPANPACLLCPLAKECLANRTGRANELPHAKVKKATQELHIALYVIADDHGRVLMRRESGKLMTSMFHLPHGDSSLLATAPLAVTQGDLLGTFRHTVTTRKIRFTVYRAELAAAPTEDCSWVEALGAVPHPSYVRKALRLARWDG